MPAASSAADREERGRRLAVRAGDPDDRQLVARIAVPPRRGDGERRRVTGRRRAAGSATSGSGRSTIAAAAPAAAAAATKSWPSTWSPGTATNSAPGRTARESSVTPRIATPARPPAPIARPSRRAPRSRPVGASAGRSGRRAGAARPAPRRRAARRSVGRAVGRVIDAGPAPRPAMRAPGAVAPRRRATRSWAPVSSTHSAAERALVLVQARTSARPRAARGARRRRRPRRGPSRSRPSRIASWIARQRRRWSAPGMRRARASAWSPEWTVDSRPPWRYRIEPAPAVAPRVAGARLEVDEVTGARAAARHQPTNAVARPEREVAPLARSRAAGRRTGRGRRRAARPGGEPSPAPSGAIRASWRTTATSSPRPRRIRWRVDLAIAVERPRRRPAGPERQRDPVARRLDLLDRRGSRRPRAPAPKRRSRPGPRGPRRPRRPPRRAASVGDRDRRRAAVRRRPPSSPGGDRARAAGRRLPPPTSGHGAAQRQHADRRRRTTRKRGRQPDAAPVLGPGARLVDVAAAARRRSGASQSASSVGGRLADRRHASRRRPRSRRPPLPAARSRRAAAPIQTRAALRRARSACRPSGSRTRSHAPM